MREAWDSDNGAFWDKFCGASTDGVNVLHYDGTVKGVAAAICVNSGYGDGIYSVYADYTKDGVIAEIRIVFIDEVDRC
jgi:hypothetical protein